MHCMWGCFVNLWYTREHATLDDGHVEEPPFCLGLEIHPKQRGSEGREGLDSAQTLALHAVWEHPKSKDLGSVLNCARLVHPTCGPTQPGDIDGLVRIHTYEACEVFTHL